MTKIEINRQELEALRRFTQGPGRISFSIDDDGQQLLVERRTPMGSPMHRMTIGHPVPELVTPQPDTSSNWDAHTDQAIELANEAAPAECAHVQVVGGVCKQCRELVEL